MITAMNQLIEMLDTHISKHKDYANRFDTGAMVAKNFAMALLEKEQSQLEDAFDMGAVRDTTGKEYFKQTYKSKKDGKSRVA